jgi:hypothetical protein
MGNAQPRVSVTGFSEQGFLPISGIPRSLPTEGVKIMAYGFRIIASLLALNVLPLAALASGRGAQLTAISHSDDAGNAYSEDGNVKIELREVRTEAIGENAKRVPLRVLVLFEPHSGAFSWRVFGDDSSDVDVPNQSTAFKNYRAAFLRNNHLVEFIIALAPTRLFINEYSGHASNMDNAEAQALMSASELAGPSGDRNQQQGVHTVSLIALGLDFVSPANSEQLGKPPKVIDVRWDANRQHWIVTLRAQWTEAITLDADYKLVSMKKVE